MKSKMEIVNNPPNFTFENEAKVVITTERSFSGFLAMADAKFEIEIVTRGKSHWYQTTMADLVTILENADERLSQSRKLVNYKN